MTRERIAALEAVPPAAMEAFAAELRSVERRSGRRDPLFFLAGVASLAALTVVSLLLGAGG